VQRYYSTKSDKDAKKMAYLVSALLFLGPPLFFFPAMAARVFIPELDMADKNVMNGVYALLCKTVLPAGSFGLVIAAMFSATMSTLAGGYNAIASVITNEFYCRIKPNATPVEKMNVARIATVFVGGAVISLTFLMQYAQGAGDLFDVTNKMFAVFVPPIAMTMLCGVLVKSVTKRAGSIALVSGIAVGIASFIIGAWVPVLREMGSMFFITSLTTIFALVVGSIIKPDTSDERKKVEEFFKRITDEEKE
jgi:Na+/proline symporter